jgi:hypothetical protein
LLWLNGGRPEWPAGPRFVVARTGRIGQIVAHLKELKPYLMVLEATSGFEAVVVAKPAQVRAFGQRADRCSSLGAATGIALSSLPDQATEQLADLLACRRIEMIGAKRPREKRANSRI